MAVRVAINGFGRIGRLVLRAILESRRNDIQVVGINDLGSTEMNAHLLKYDSVHGILTNDVSVDGDRLSTFLTHRCGGCFGTPRKKVDTSDLCSFTC